MNNSPNIAYARLFGFRIFHGFYLDNYAKDSDGLVQLARFVDLPEPAKEGRIADQPYNIHQDFDIRPTGATTELLRNYKMAFRRSPLGFFAGLRTSGSQNQPPQMFIPLERPISLVFELFLKNRHFLNFSEIELEGLSRQVYFFSNRSSLSGTGLNIGIGGFNFHAFGQDSRLQLHRDKLDYSFNPGDGLTAARFTVSGAFDGNVRIQEEARPPAGQVLERHTLGLSKLADGLYRLKAEGLAPSYSILEFDFYKHSPPPFERPFAIVELALVPGAAPFFDAGGGLLSPMLNLYVDNRQTSWRYFSGLAPETLIAASPARMYLARHGYSPLSHNGKQLPNPSEKALTAEPDGYYSDTYL